MHLVLMLSDLPIRIHLTSGHLLQHGYSGVPSDLGRRSASIAPPAHALTTLQGATPPARDVAASSGGDQLHGRPVSCGRSPQVWRRAAPSIKGGLPVILTPLTAKRSFERSGEHCIVGR